MFCCTLLYVHSSIAIILMGNRELVALLNLSSWCLVMVERLFLAVPRGCLGFVIVVFPDHTYLFFKVLHGKKDGYKRVIIRCYCSVLKVETPGGIFILGLFPWTRTDGLYGGN